MGMVDVRLQHFVIARFADYCAFDRPLPADSGGPVLYLLQKLDELEGPLCELKQGLFESQCKHMLKRAADGVTPEEAADFRSVLEGYLAPADFYDASFHLMEPHRLKEPEALKRAAALFSGLKAAALRDEEARPEEKRSALYKRLTGDLYKRLGLEALETVKRRRPLTPRRLRMIVRRCRRETAEYAAVFHFPVRPDDTFTPFIIPRIEALVCVNRRFLRTLQVR